MKATLLVIEDDPSIAHILQSTLSLAHYRVIHASTAQAGLEKYEREAVDLVLLDLGLPDKDGKQVIQQIRTTALTPIVVLSARSRESDIVACLDLGADDYVVKPVGAAQLLARIRVALRHVTTKEASSVLVQTAELSIDLSAHVVRLSEHEVHLTPKEFGLLALLAQAAGKVVTHRKLLSEVWGSEYVDHSHYLRIHMGNLRAKLERDPSQPRFILTEPAVGYRLALL